MLKKKKYILKAVTNIFDTLNNPALPSFAWVGAHLLP